VRKKCGWYPSLVPRLISAWAVQKRVKNSSQGWIFFRSSDDKTAQSSQTYPVLSDACRSSHEPSDHFPKSYVELVVPWWVNSSKFWQKNLPPIFFGRIFFQIKYVDMCHEASLLKKNKPKFKIFARILLRGVVEFYLANFLLLSKHRHPIFCP